MDRIEAMSTLLAAVQAGSLSGASRKLGMPLATVSRKVSELEAHLRTKLINRTSRRLTLTDAGRSYVVGCKRILEDLEEIEQAAAGEYIVVSTAEAAIDAASVAFVGRHPQSRLC
jgi:DNA-binding transcriptional LysR family regulator